MRHSLVAGIFVGLSALGHSAAVANEAEPRVNADVTKILRTFRGHADARHFDHGGPRFSRMAKQAEDEVLAQSFTVGTDFYRVSIPVGGDAAHGSVVRLQAPAFGTVTAASPWVSVVRKGPERIERQTIAADFRTIKDLVRKEVTRLFRIQRDYALSGFGDAGVTVRAQGKERITALRVKTALGRGVFTGFDTMLGEILGFRATTDHLFVYTSAMAEYEVPMILVDGKIKFGPGRLIGNVEKLLRTESRSVPGSVEPARPCAGEFGVQSLPTDDASIEKASAAE